MPSTPPPIHDPLLQTAPAQVSAQQAAAIAREYFGLDGSLQRLAGERDLNFRIDAPAGSRLLKLSHPLEDPQVVDFQNGALLQLQRLDPELPVQRVYPAADGAYRVWVEVDGQRMLARLLSFVDGLPLHRVERRTPALQRALGTALARLDRALHDYEHPAARRELLWDLQLAPRLRPLLVHITERGQRALVERALDAFELHAQPRLAQLRAQVIHNDLNPHNVIVAAESPEQLRNILDFGDMVHAPLINDVAVAAAYQLGTDGDVLAPALTFIAAYHRGHPLQAAELEILAELIATRLLLTLSITAWRASLYPENRDYILRNADQARASLQGLAALPRAEVQARILRACHEESPA